MLGIKTKILAALRTGFPQMFCYRGGNGMVWAAGALDRAPSVAEFFCGEGTQVSGYGRIRRSQVLAQATKLAADGIVSILFTAPGGPSFPDPAGRDVEAPLRIVLRKTLPKTSEALISDIKTSTTQEDLRRIRKAGFTFRITKDPEDIRTFHARHYAPLVAQRFPEDGSVMLAKDLIESLEQGGELVCADIDGEWVAGLYNWANGNHYAMGPLGIRDADVSVRQKRVVSALLVGSMQRAVELGCQTATLGFSVPFLGKGPIWFKAKWGCTLEAEPRSPKMQIFVDLRHDPVRKALAASPLVHLEGADLVVSTWLLEGEAPLNTLISEAGRFSGISRWYVFATPETLDEARNALDANYKTVPVSVDLNAAGPLWLGQLLRR